ncbi:glycosyltransferase family 4 protein [Roseiconus nitratireducens]|uniref:Glycosyltransferase family 4 protein n=1 Tax=Roseiconus nitratireducens TaxID=2605748 RepID=A0A5M6DID5_9BACT|nr:glycosyltransferase family 4 protein [Roseiconus nitratireducens]KAA5546136.1 glycosyltransferase family 4 protein [Roseiconus nitratireducens]
MRAPHEPELVQDRAVQPDLGKLPPLQDAPKRVGVLLTEFPNQTSVAMWRVAVAMRQLGRTVSVVSTRRNDQPGKFDRTFGQDISDAFYAWPPQIGSALSCCLSQPGKVVQCLRYIASLRDEPIRGRLKLVLMILGSASLSRFCRQRDIQHLVVHSMANAAHLVTMAKLLGGPRFSLRLGGDLEVYGGDHPQKTQHADLIIAAAENNRQQVIQELKISPDRVMQSSLGVDTQRFTPPADRAALQTPVRLLTVARLNKTKGHAFAIEAIALLRDRGIECSYTLYGEGPYRSAIEDQIRSLDLQQQVKLAGVADEATVIESLRQADLFLLPSVGLGEATPVSVLEAMSCGLPAIVSRIGGTPDIIDSWHDGVIVPQADSTAIAESIERLVSDPALHTQMADAARQRAVNSFDSRQVAAKLLHRIASVSDADRPSQDSSPVQ